MHGGTLLNPELPEDRAPQPIAHGGGQRESEPGSHGQPEIPDTAGVSDARVDQGIHCGQPICRHPIKDHVDPFVGDANLVWRR
jgi:hypothetical protein